MTLPQRRAVVAAVWLPAVALTIYAFAFHREAVQQQMRTAESVSLLASAAVYLLLGAVRGFTLIPATSLVLLGVAFFPPGWLFGLTLAGILISSASVYGLASSMHFDDLFPAKYRVQYERLRNLLSAHELSVVILWSFFPLAPTDLICYVCGAMRVKLRTCLLGVAIGEGAICAVYIFFGDRLLRGVGLK